MARMTSMEAPEIRIEKAQEKVSRTKNDGFSRKRGRKAKRADR